MWKQQMPGEILIQRGVGRRDSKIAQLSLRLRPRQIERASSAVWIVVQIRKLDCAFLLLGDERGERNADRRTWRNTNAHTQRKNRIEHGAHRSGELRAFIERFRVSDRP